jgi:predicted ATPase
VAEGLRAAETNVHVSLTAELYRLKGEIMLEKLSAPSPQHLTPGTREAEGCFHKAIDIARRQESKSLELRAAVSLSRLWQQQGRVKGARHILMEAYGWFTEGFDTADLREAKALLAELA